ncbi:MAG: FxsA family protein [Myxococcales bacterium]|nr:FxsA family protein [Myxococcales bacterium]
MGWLLFVLFVALPFVDLVLLLRVGSLLGFWPTVALTLAMGALGAWLAKREGLRVWRAWTRALSELRAPEQGIIDGVLVIAGGALLMAPGVLTDVVGFAFLIPPTRKLIAGLVRRGVDRRIARGQLHVVTTGFGPFAPEGRGDGGPGPTAGGVVETTGETVDDPASRRALGPGR